MMTGRIKMGRNFQVRLGLFILSVVSVILIAGCSPAASAPVEETAANKITVSLPGTDSAIFVTDRGKLLKKAQFNSADGNVSLYIDPGTILQDKNNTPLQSIKVTVDTMVPIPPENIEVVGDIVDIQPQGAVVIPSLKLALTYDPSALPQGVNENDLWVYNYTGTTWEEVRNKNTDAGANRVTASISRFGKYSVLAPVTPLASPTLLAPQGLTSITITQSLKNGKPTLAEFGRGTCIPCKEMKPILEDLALQYQDKLNVPIVSIDEYMELTTYYKVMAIPTQIGFDSGGKEVFRHIGFWPKDQIISQFGKLGIK
jgi:thioredoxin 1